MNKKNGSSLKKIIILVSVVTIFYVLVGILTNVYYEEMVDRQIGREKIIIEVMSNEDSPKEERFLVYEEDNLIKFAVVEGRAIAPFKIAHVPAVTSSYTVNPSKLDTIDGYQGKEKFHTADGNIRNGVVFTGSTIHTKYGMIGSLYLYIGITDHEMKANHIESYSLDHLSEDKFLFMIKSEKEVEFEEFLSIPLN